jgi:hypothetical protein
MKRALHMPNSNSCIKSIRKMRKKLKPSPESLSEKAFFKNLAPSLHHNKVEHTDVGTRDSGFSKSSTATLLMR